MTLATIAIPTYNRASTLGRAADSALAQDYPSIELIISDHSSNDGTQALCQDLVRRDPRVRYLRQSRDVGPMANFGAALAEASGEYFMWLADDDWLDENYVTECIKALADGAVLGAGRSRWFDADREVSVEAPTNLSHGNGATRVRTFYRTVTKVSVFYGLSRTSTIRSRGPILECTGGDWLFVASLAFLGRVETLETTSIHRALGGVSDLIVDAQWTIPRSAARHILQSSGYDGLGRVRRTLLAVECAVLVGWRVGIWFPVLGLLRRRLGETRYERVRELYRRIGGGNRGSTL